MNKEIFNKLHSFIGSDKLISVYADAHDPEAFAVGFAIQINNDNILLNMVNRAGEENAFIYLVRMTYLCLAMKKNTLKKLKSFF
jgi:quinolinate synthase